MSARTTKRARSDKGASRASDNVANEYRLDYKKARANRFAGEIAQDAVVVVLDADVAEVFTDPKRVNALLRATIAALPKARSRKAG